MKLIRHSLADFCRPILVKQKRRTRSEMSLAPCLGELEPRQLLTGNIYDVGSPDAAYQNLSDLQWNDLQPGDVVNIHMLNITF